MKKKLRKIIVGEHTYLYSLTNSIYLETFPDFVLLKIFLEGHKKTPLSIYFYMQHDYLGGFPLTTGTKLRHKETNSEEIVNLHQPKYIRKLILLGREKGWTGDNLLEKQDGLAYLSELGYEIEKIIL